MEHAGTGHWQYIDFAQALTWITDMKELTVRPPMPRRQGIAILAVAVLNCWTMISRNQVRMWLVPGYGRNEGARRLYLRRLLLHDKNAMDFDEIPRVKRLQTCSFGEASKARYLSVDYAEWVPVLKMCLDTVLGLSYLFLLTSLGSCQPSSRQHLWTDHRDMFITDTCHCFRRYGDVLTEGSNSFW